MSLRDDVEALVCREENAGTLLAEYLAGCLNAYEPKFVAAGGGDKSGMGQAVVQVI